MANCLVTKLKGSVSSDLPKLGRFRVTFYGNMPEDTGKIVFTLPQGEYIDIIGATFRDGTTRWTSVAGSTTLNGANLPLSGPFTLDFPKYGRFNVFKIDELLGYNYHIDPITIKDLCGYQNYMYNVTVTRVSSGTATVTGNLRDMGDNCGTDAINFYGQDVEGDINDLYHCYANSGSIPTVNLALCPKVTGNLKTLLDRIFQLQKYIDMTSEYFLYFYMIGSSIDVSDFPDVDRDRSTLRVYSNGDGTYRVVNA